jgi:hypothetical protein
MAAVTRARGRMRWWIFGAPTPLLERLVDDPDAVLAGPGSVARARMGRKRFFRVTGGPGEIALYVKVFELRGGARLRYWLRPSKARREQACASRVAARGFEVAAPLAVGEERRLGLLARSLSVIAERPGADLRALLGSRELSRERRRRLLRGFATLARRLHDAGVDQDDFSPNNFLAAPDDRLVLLDFERCAVGRPLGDRRWTLLAKLARHGAVSSSERLRFLADYLGEGCPRAERRAVALRILRELARIRARDARRAGRAAFRPGRHVRREGDAWIVVGREGARVVRLDLGARAAREAWVRAHQLERLGLPALRPVRLRDGVLELEDPGPGPHAERDALIRRARRALERFGRLASAPDWHIGPGGALLRDPRAFEPLPARAAHQTTKPVAARARPPACVPPPRTG